MPAGGSLPWLLEKDGDDGEGQEDHSGRATDHQAQDAAMHLHGLASLSRVEEGMTGDTPEGTGHRGGCVWEPSKPPALSSDKRQHINNGSSICLAQSRELDMIQCI